MKKEKQKPHESITISDENFSLEIKLKEPLLTKLYRENPIRVKKMIEGRFYSVIAEIYTGGELDEAINAINAFAEEKKEEIYEGKLKEIDRIIEEFENSIKN